MNQVPRSVWMLLILALLWVANDWTRREIVHSPGELVSEQPRQSNLRVEKTFVIGEFTAKQRAQFELRARVLSTERYYLGADAGLSPIDLALGWGPMSDQAVLDRIDISQGNRWYFTRYEYPAPIADKEIIRNSGNMHIIPADSHIERELKKLKRGDVINLRGYLVDVKRDTENGNFTWKTSLTREDTGGGSCELFLVEFIQTEGATLSN